MKLQLFPNLTGLRGTERTIAHMRRLVESGKTDPKVVLKAHDLVRNIDRNAASQMASTLFKFVRDNIAYIRDPVGVEFVKSAAITLKTKTGDCDDQAVLFSTLAEGVGLNTRFKAVKADPRYPGEFSHVYSQVDIPGKGWVSADTIVPGAQFGWEATGFRGRTWGGVGGLGFITVDKDALGDATFAAGSVSADEEPADNFLGEPFGYETIPSGDADDASGGGGKLWADDPLMASGNEEIDTIVDADEDHWGGSTDTMPGPGLKSRMLPPGVGGMNVLTVGSLGGPLKKFFKNPKKAFRSAGKKIAKSAERLAAKVGFSTPDTRKKASRKAVSAAAAVMWDGDGVQIGLELLRRAEDVIAAQREGRVSQYVKGPPPAMQGLRGLRGFLGKVNIDLKSATKAAASSTPVGAAVVMAADMVEGVGKAQDQQAAAKAVDRYITNFPIAQLQAAVERVSTSFVAAGGMMPSPSDRAPSEWITQYRTRARAGKDTSSTGPEYWDLQYLTGALNAVIPALDAARQILSVAHQAQATTTGAQTIQAAANVVQSAMEAGTVRPEEAAAALAITKKLAEGYALTPEEEALAARIAAGAKKRGGALWMAIPAAAAAAAVLLI